MKNENTQAKHHRGSSPPFREAEQGVHEWIKELKPVDKLSENIPMTRASQKRGNEKRKSIDQKFDSCQTNNVETDQQSFDEAKSQQNKDDETRWQDDGGEGGLKY